MEEINILEEQRPEEPVLLEKMTEEQKFREQEWKKIGAQFPFYGGICLLFGIIYTLCLYENPCGITFPLLVIAGYELALLVLKKQGVPLKKGSYFLMGVSVLLGIASCRTASGFLLFFNNLALILLGGIFWIHQFYDDRVWNIGKYMGSLVLFFCRIVGTLMIPFRHLGEQIASLKDGKSKNVIYVLTGILVSIPLLLVLLTLLSHADMVFEELWTDFMDSFLRPEKAIKIILMIVAGTLGAYCLICASVGKGIKEEQKDRRVKEPIIAITAMGLVSLLYMLFCGIQIIYLFLGKGSLPEGVTYSEYARQGFFQLVFVACFNLVMVLLCLKYFKKSPVLNLVLTIISLCTYVMIASAGLRMLMYIGAYHLTLLRVLVLWGLGVMALLMVGVMTIIYRNQFPLFRYCLTVVSLSYLLLAWVRPDSIIAEYNVAYVSEWTQSDYFYVKWNLSLDAAPAVLEAEKDPEWIEEYYDVQMEYKKTYGKGIRKYNFSVEKARKAFEAVGLTGE